ncbi:Ppx/GppA phosphatase family protein [Hyphococcus luteus]|uniref:Exopolyphosphatase n=1 Tax=Hyphococcus luteus TaxID=2058213 RepID=A0A2S7K302_9PROT|nr:Ppx/GppA phosphatase family protein [Marinicaulis flavus]PQA86882.1 exopolyphosphatase [Marinicaulis flavus]
MDEGKRGRRAGGEDSSGRAPGEKKSKKRNSRRRGGGRREPVRLAALDLGTNNCRLLIAAPRGRDFRIVDAFSRIVRLGEGLSQSGVLSENAMERTIAALAVCAEKIERRSVTHMRCIATQACRGARNGLEFLEKASARTGLQFDIISTEEEARLSVAGCAELLDKDAEAGLVFDIGGGSTELSWVRRNEKDGRIEIAAWTSLPFGVVSIAEKWGGRDMNAQTYAAVVAEARAAVARIGDPAGMRESFVSDRAHLLGTSGTVTSIAGVHLGLPRYRRDKVDGLWLTIEDARGVTEKLRVMRFEERAAEPCIGEERADLVVSGCAILEALQAEWPASRVRVADRGLREGILADLARQARQSRKR